VPDGFDRRDIGAWFSWDVVLDETRDIGACGVSSDQERAVNALDDALRASPSSAWGEVWQVELCQIGRTATYRYVSLVARLGAVPHPTMLNGGEPR
jgi:hypothetical protein